MSSVEAGVGTLALSHVFKCSSSTPLLDSYPRDLVPPTGDASGGAEEGKQQAVREMRTPLL